jgi:SAM-dependent methyltransferase
VTGPEQARLSSGYARYLTSKISVDDRALSRPVLAELGRLWPAGSPWPARVLEIGAGLGTMVARLMDWGVLSAGEYTLLDTDRELLADSRRWLRAWAAARGVRSAAAPDGPGLGDPGLGDLGLGDLELGDLQLGDVRVRLRHAELGDYLGTGPEAQADVLIANAVLDLVDVPAVLPGLLRLLRPGGAYWFTINYDGESIFTPDHPADDQVLAAYHRDMDERIRYGRPAGQSRTGRHLFRQLRAAGAPAWAAGASDWVVSAAPDGAYPQDEAYFLGCILNTIEAALAARPDRVRPADLADWLAVRRRQLAGGELVYLAHQLDFAGRGPG